MGKYICIITASIGIEVKAENYSEAVKKGLKAADDLQEMTMGTLKYLGVKWELDCVQKEKDA